MNEFKQWFEQKLHSLGVTKLKLVEQVGYANTSKGLRRLNQFLEQPHKTHNEFIKAICLKLNLDMAELCEKIAERRKYIEPNPEPFIQLIYPPLDTIRPLFHRGWLRALLRETVPKIIQRLPLDEKNKQLENLYNKKLASLDDDLSRQITGFTYFCKKE
ncbi:hypothetical protein [Litorilituus lipolyticus]|uniref:Uncharacterized protein n=1 Tax=Litorilituus lipolyticus TaxID=2491017 RepID=A0A502KQ37_9GAMM|nr:hypothetical protein [Litorilituus lipolyticus]TPH13264.1 hypothetical protein EPA86_13805 [Litorilituus lipolyticus]